MKWVVVISILSILLFACSQTADIQNPQAGGHRGHMMGGSSTNTPVERSIEGLQNAVSMKNVDAQPTTYQMSANIVKKEIFGQEIRMFGYNNQIPGPLFWATQGEFMRVNFTNNIDMETTVHWHGIRIENKYDGIPEVTQPSVKPGESFLYEVRFPDSGMFWYHPHVREDYQQELGLYGAIIVDPKVNEYAKVNREKVLILDDIKMEGDDVPSYEKDEINHALMGRFGNVMLVNGQEDYTYAVQKGDVVRFYIGNVANVRPFKLSFTNAKMKVIGGDIGPYQQEFFNNTLIIGPAERYIVDVMFTEAGEQYLMHSTHHGSYTLMTINVSDKPTLLDYSKDFSALRVHPSVKKEFDALDLASYRSKKPDVDWQLTINVQGMGRMMHADEDNLEYEDPMPMMSPLMTNNTLKWQIVDRKTGKANMDNMYHWKKGDMIKIRMFNDPTSMHPMQHPIHFHGQRFVVLSTNGKPNTNPVWKDTTLIPVGAEVEILLEITNPGDWMAHCHIAEHLQAGMMTMFMVGGEDNLAYMNH